MHVSFCVQSAVTGEGYVLGDDGLFFEMTHKPVTCGGRYHVAKDYQVRQMIRHAYASRTGLTERIVEDALCG